MKKLVSLSNDLKAKCLAPASAVAELWLEPLKIAGQACTSRTPREEAKHQIPQRHWKK
jgi:hypothetical protein